ncbi:SGNH/GDSL hydrolase family protein [Roseovarius nitratireducens]|uniref:SGNH/GDSL hydrolase family protein n=1 Tax=Roseovarius nitratireducens TaxID=2044597 RepID=UPI000CE21C81|nr:SGNH/GDSL hydrolase family protein [Roseovarius nitratireducens]
MLTRLLTALFLLSVTQAGLAHAGGQNGPRVLMMGDSLFAMHKLAGGSVGTRLRAALDAHLVDNSVGGARFLYRLPISGALGLNIAKQYRRGDWDWVVLGGGGNDLWLGCGCNRCERKMDQMISEDGRRGVIPGLASRARHDGAQVLLVGYMRTPGNGSPIEHCADEGDMLDARLARLAGLDGGVHFLSLADMVPHGDLSYHAMDRIHPSFKGSRAIAHRIARLIAAESGAPVVSRGAGGAD